MPAPLAPPPPVMSTLRTNPRQGEPTRRCRAKMTTKCRVNQILAPERMRTPTNLQVSRGPSVRL